MHRRARTAHRARQRPKRKTETALTAPTSVLSRQKSQLPRTHGPGSSAGRGAGRTHGRSPHPPRRPTPALRTQGPPRLPQRSERMGRRAYHSAPNSGAAAPTGGAGTSGRIAAVSRTRCRIRCGTTGRSLFAQRDSIRRRVSGSEGGVRVSGSEGGRCTGSQEERQQLPSPKSPRRGWWEGMV